VIAVPYIDKRLELRLVPEISGWGVFATEFIAEGEIIELAPIILMPKKLIDVAIWACQAEGIPNKDLMIDQYCIKWKEDMACPLGWVGLYNHSDNNNANFIGNFESNLIGVQTIKDLNPCQQVLVYYSSDWFTEKGYINKVEF
jgi:hypothetical protein